MPLSTVNPNIGCTNGSSALLDFGKNPADTASVLAGAGLLGILLGFGLQKLMQDMINGFFIIFENQYVVGEYVSINNNVGQVLELGLKTTKILTYNGEIHYFANGDITSVINYSRNDSLSIIDLPILHKYLVDEIIELC